MGLRAYIAKRIVYTLILLFLVLTLNFIIFEATPGNPLEAYIARVAQSGRKDIQEIINKMRELWGLNKPLHEKYVIYIKNMLTFNFGYSYIAGHEDVSALILGRLPNTLLLLGISSLLAVILGTIFGVLAASKRGKPFDTTMVIISLLTFALPTFWIGMILQGIFAFQLKILPVQGYEPIPPPKEPFAYILGRIYYLILPCLTLFLFTYGGYVLLARAATLENITEDYVITAKAKGLKDRTILFKHVLKNASLPIITNAALTFASILGGAIITETVFSYAGIGTLIYESILLHDTPVMQAFFYITALCTIIANFIADLLYGVIDPRIKYG